MSRELPRDQRPRVPPDCGHAAYDSISLNCPESRIVKVRCSGKLHRIMLTSKGRLVLLDHGTHDDKSTAMLVVETLSDEKCRCREIKEAFLDCCCLPSYSTRTAAGLLPPMLRAWASRCHRQHWARSGKAQWTMVASYGADTYRMRKAYSRISLAAYLTGVAIRDATYGSQYAKDIQIHQLSPSQRIGVKMLGRISHSKRRSGCRTLNIDATIEPVALLMARHHMGGTLLASHGKRRVAVLRVLDRYYDGGMLVVAGRQETAPDPWARRILVVVSRRAVIERHPKRKGWRVRQWLEE